MGEHPTDSGFWDSQHLEVICQADDAYQPVDHRLGWESAHRDSSTPTAVPVAERLFDGQALHTPSPLALWSARWYTGPRSGHTVAPSPWVGSSGGPACHDRPGTGVLARQGTRERHWGSALRDQQTQHCPRHRHHDGRVHTAEDGLDPAMNRGISYLCGRHDCSLLHAGGVMVGTVYDDRVAANAQCGGVGMRIFPFSLCPGEEQGRRVHAPRAGWPVIGRVRG